MRKPEPNRLRSLNPLKILKLSEINNNKKRAIDYNLYNIPRRSLHTNTIKEPYFLEFLTSCGFKTSLTLSSVVFLGPK